MFAAAMGESPIRRMPVGYRLCRYADGALAIGFADTPRMICDKLTIKKFGEEK